MELEVDFCDIVARRDGVTLFAEAKGETTSPGLDVDTMYGQILRRMPIAENERYRVAAVVPMRARDAALRIPKRTRDLLRIGVYVVMADGEVLHVG